MKVPFQDLSIKDNREREKIVSAIDKVLKHGRLILGPEVAELEESVAAYCGTKYAAGVNSGTDALFLSLKAMGIGKGDEVITTCLSWIATTNAIASLDAAPVFGDVKEDFNIDPDKIEDHINSNTKAIVPVHFTGKICEMEKILSIGEKYNIPVVEDAAQAFGAEYMGKRAGSMGLLSSFSLNPMKVFGAIGEAGIVVTNDEALYEQVKILRYNGTVGRHEAHYVSLNSRLDTIHATVLLERLKDLEKNIQKRRSLAEYYSKNLKEVIKVPEETKNGRDVYFTYNCICADRDNLKVYLEDNGIETKIHHDILMPMHKVYRQYYKENDYIVGEELCKNSLCLPMFEKLTFNDLDYVIDKIHTFYKK